MKERGAGLRDQAGKQSRLRYSAGPLIIFLAAFLSIAPQLIRGNSCGHDFNVHLVSWLTA